MKLVNCNAQFFPTISSSIAWKWLQKQSFLCLLLLPNRCNTPFLSVIADHILGLLPKWKQKHETGHKIGIQSTNIWPIFPNTKYWTIIFVLHNRTYCHSEIFWEGKQTRGFFFNVSVLRLFTRMELHRVAKTAAKLTQSSICSKASANTKTASKLEDRWDPLASVAVLCCCIMLPCCSHQCYHAPLHTLGRALK